MSNKHKRNAIASIITNTAKTQMDVISAARPYNNIKVILLGIKQLFMHTIISIRIILQIPYLLKNSGKNNFIVAKNHLKNGNLKSALLRFKISYLTSKKAINLLYISKIYCSLRKEKDSIKSLAKYYDTANNGKNATLQMLRNLCISSHKLNRDEIKSIFHQQMQKTTSTL